MTTSTSDTTRSDTAALIRAEAVRLGFDACRFADVTQPWPASGRLASMKKLERELAFLERKEARGERGRRR